MSEATHPEVNAAFINAEIRKRLTPEMRRRFFVEALKCRGVVDLDVKLPECPWCGVRIPWNGLHRCKHSPWRTP